MKHPHTRALVSVVPVETLDTARATAEETGQSISRVLIDDHGITEEVIGEALTRTFRTPYVPWSDDLKIESVEGLDEQSLRYYQVVPIGKKDGKVIVIMENPLDLPKRDEVAMILGIDQVEFRVALAETIRKLMGLPEAPPPPPPPREDDGEDEPDVQMDMLGVEESPVVKLVNMMLVQIIRNKVRELHIPGNSRQDMKWVGSEALISPPPAMRSDICNRLKVMAGLNPVRYSEPVEKEIRIKYEGTEIVFRIEVRPEGTDREDVIVRVD